MANKEASRLRAAKQSIRHHSIFTISIGSKVNVAKYTTVGIYYYIN